MSTRSRVSIRPARDDDDLDALNAGNPVWLGAAPMRASFAASGDTPVAMYVGELDGAAVGYAHAVGAGVVDGHRGFAHVFVLPGHRGHGVGGALWQAARDICTPERVRGVSVECDDVDLVSQGIALAHGFTRAGLHLESELDLAGIDALTHLLERPLPDGVVIRPLPDDIDEAGWREFKATFDRLMMDTPDQASGAEPMPYEVFRALQAEPWQVMAAWLGGAMIGFTAVMVRNEADGRLNTQLTGVERSHRGLGLSTAMKLTHAYALRDVGWRTIVTQNMQGNNAILASNRTLGFRPSVGLRDLTYDYPAGR